MSYFKAVTNKIIVEVLATIENKTEGGLIIPSSVDNKPQSYGKVLTVGGDVKTIQTGDTIIFAKFGGQDILENDGKKVLKVLMEEEVYAIVKDEE